MNRIDLAKRKRLRTIFLIAAITGIGIIACQLYWVYYNYRTTRSNFVQLTSISLRHGIDSCLLGQSKLPPSLAEKIPSLTFMMKQQMNPDSPAKNTGEKPEPTYTVRLETVTVNEDQLPGVKALVARLFSLRHNTPLSLDTLTRIFHEELLRNNIREEFKLAIDSTTNKIEEGEIAAPIHFNKKAALVRAEIKNPNRFLFRMNLAPALISTLLIALSAASLFYMGRIIKKQMHLDSMKTDFVNNIIHELRTPLTILRTSNEAMASFGASHDEQSLMRYLGINSLVIDDLDKNIERILDFSKIEQGKRLPVLETIDLIPILKQAQLRFRQAGNAAITITSNQDPFDVTTDRFMIGIILSNLIDNAIKYSPEEPKIEIQVRRMDKGWQLLVNDEGAGIPKSSIPFIFDKFYRVPTGDLHEIKGYGIGLAYVKQLVVDLNGKIEVASELGKGSVFTITFNV